MNGKKKQRSEERLINFKEMFTSCNDDEVKAKANKWKKD